jgi:hypothetical protein
MKRRPDRVPPEFPKPDPDDEVRSNQVRLKEKLWRRLKKIAAEQEPKKSMNDVITFFLEWAADDYEQAKARRTKK